MCVHIQAGLCVWSSVGCDGFQAFVISINMFLGSLSEAQSFMSFSGHPDEASQILSDYLYSYSEEG